MKIGANNNANDVKINRAVSKIPNKEFKNSCPPFSSFFPRYSE